MVHGVSGNAAIVEAIPFGPARRRSAFSASMRPRPARSASSPKGTWDCSTAAINALASMIDGKTVHCVGSEIDDHLASGLA